MCTELLRLIEDYEAENAILQDLSEEVTGSKEVTTGVLQNEVGTVQILKSPDAQSSHIDKKVDKLAQKLAKLSLIVRNRPNHRTFENQLMPIVHDRIVSVQGTEPRTVLKTNFVTQFAQKVGNMAY